MEMIYMEVRLLKKMMDRFDAFVNKANAVCGKSNMKGIES